jgi:hypothetical protein
MVERSVASRFCCVTSLGNGAKKRNVNLLRDERPIPNKIILWPSRRADNQDNLNTDGIESLIFRHNQGQPTSNVSILPCRPAAVSS